MFTNSKDNLGVKEFDIIYRHALNVGDIGICKWNMDKEEMYIDEYISGYELNNIKNMKEFLTAIAYHKDRDLAIRDLEDYLNGTNLYYLSTFRIKTKAGDIKWVLVKGKILKDEDIRDKVLHVLIFNVTGSKLHEGHDIMTNLINDRFFLRKLKNAIQVAKAQNKQGALIYIDIDNFITINNNYGFQFGNLVIREIAKQLNSLISQSCELAT